MIGTYVPSFSAPVRARLEARHERQFATAEPAQRFRGVYDGRAAPDPVSSRALGARPRGQVLSCAQLTIAR
jgi:hypothetical protein